MSKENCLTLERVRGLLDYDPETGVFTWKGGDPRMTGKHAGSRDRRGYITIRIDGVPFYAHRLAMLLTDGAWPRGMVDHRNLDKADNRRSNLRLGNNGINQQNIPLTGRKSRSGLVGAHWVESRGKWRSSIKKDGAVTMLGYFGTADEAHAAYVAAKRVVHNV